MARLVAALLCLAFAHRAAAQIDGAWSYYGSTQCSSSSATATYTVTIDTRGGDGTTTDALYLTLTNTNGLSTAEQMVSGPFQGARTITLDNVEDVGTVTLLRLRKPGNDAWRWSRISVSRNGAVATTFLASTSDVVGGSSAPSLMQACAEPAVPAGFTLDCWGGTVVGSAFGCQLSCSAGNVLLRGVPNTILCDDQGKYPLLASLSASLFCRPASATDYAVTISDIAAPGDGHVFLTLLGSLGTSSEVNLGSLPSGQFSASVNADNVGDVSLIRVRTNSTTTVKAGNIKVGASSFILGGTVPLSGGSLVGEMASLCTVPVMTDSGVTASCLSTAAGTRASMVGGRTTTISSGCQLRCRPGQRLVGPSVITCGSDGAWSDYSEVTCAADLVPYDVVVSVALTANAQSCSGFFLSLGSETGYTSEEDITPTDGCYNANQSYPWTLMLEDIGPINRVKPRMTNNDGWLIREITVSRNGRTTSHVAGFDWLDGDDNDRRGHPDTKEFCAQPEPLIPDMVVDCETTAISINNEIAEGCYLSCKSGMLYTQGPAVLHCSTGGVYSNRGLVGASANPICTARQMVTYKVDIVTVSGQQTSNPIRIQFIGSLGVSGFKLLSEFGASGTQTFNVQSEDVGTIRSIRLNLLALYADDGTSPRWRMQSATVTAPSEQVASFISDVGDTISHVTSYVMLCALPTGLAPSVDMRCSSVHHQHGSGCHFRCPESTALLGPPLTLCMADGTWTDFSATRCSAVFLPKITYTVAVATYVGRADSQTGNAVTIALIGAQGSTRERALGTSFQQEVKTVTHTTEDVGTLKGIRLFLGSTDGWLPQWVKLTGPDSITYLVNNQGWLDGDGASHQQIFNTREYCVTPAAPGNTIIACVGNAAEDVSISHVGCVFTCATGSVYSGPAGQICRPLLNWEPYGKIGTNANPTCTVQSAQRTYTATIRLGTTGGTSGIKIFYTIIGANGATAERQFPATFISAAVNTDVSASLTVEEVGTVRGIRMRFVGAGNDPYTAWGQAWRITQLTLTSGSESYIFNGDPGDVVSADDRQVLTFCARPTIPTGITARTVSTAYYFGSGLHFQCADTAQVLTGGVTSTQCQPDGTWTDFSSISCVTPTTGTMAYDIWVVTSTKPDSNSASTFFLALIGDAGQATEINITPSGGSYALGQKSNFQGTIPSIGSKILAVKPRHTNNDGWLIEYVNVTYNGQLTRHFAGFDWIDGDDNDRRGNPETKEFCALPETPSVPNIVLDCETTAISINEEISEGCYYSCARGYVYTGPLTTHCDAGYVYKNRGTGTPTCTASPANKPYKFNIATRSGSTTNPIDFMLHGTKGQSSWYRVAPSGIGPSTIDVNANLEDVGDVLTLVMRMEVLAHSPWSPGQISVTYKNSGNEDVTMVSLADAGDIMDAIAKYEVRCFSPTVSFPMSLRCGGTNHGHGSGCHLMCPESMALEGLSTIKCGIDGKWSDFSQSKCSGEAAPLINYRFTVQTYVGQGNAQTAGRVAFALAGTSGTTGERTLSTNFPQGVKAEFTVQAEDVGKIKTLRLFLDSTDGWLPQSVKMVYTPQGSPELTSMFYSQEWLDGDGVSVLNILDTINFCAFNEADFSPFNQMLNYACPSTAATMYGCYATCKQDGMVYNGPVGYECHMLTVSSGALEPFGSTAKAAGNGSPTCTSRPMVKYDMQFVVKTAGQGGTKQIFFSLIGSEGVSKERSLGTVGNGMRSGVDAEDVGTILAIRLRSFTETVWGDEWELDNLRITKQGDSVTYVFEGDDGDGLTAEDKTLMTFCAIPQLPAGVDAFISSTAALFGSGVHFGCPKGQILKGNSTSHCQLSGVYSPPVVASCVDFDAATYSVRASVTVGSSKPVNIAFVGASGETPSIPLNGDRAISASATPQDFVLSARGVGALQGIRLTIDPEDQFAAQISVAYNGTTTDFVMARGEQLSGSGVGTSALLCGKPKGQPTNFASYNCISTVQGNPEGCRAVCGAGRLLQGAADRVLCTPSGLMSSPSTITCAASSGFDSYAVVVNTAEATTATIYVSFVGPQGVSSELILGDGLATGPVQKALSAEVVGNLQQLRLRLEGEGSWRPSKITVTSQSVAYEALFDESDSLGASTRNGVSGTFCTLPPRMPSGVQTTCYSTSAAPLSTGCQFSCGAGSALSGKQAIQCQSAPLSCSAGQQASCGANSICLMNSDGSAVCACVTGYETQGSSCTDIDECTNAELIAKSCKPNSVCQNLPGSFDCICQPPYTGNGFTGCSLGNCSSITCGPNYECDIVDDVPTCVCKGGFELKGGSCTDKDECADGSHNCADGQVCVNLPDGNGFRCDSGDGSGTDTPSSPPPGSPSSSSSSSLSGGAIAGIIIAVLLLLLIIVVVVVSRRRQQSSSYGVNGAAKAADPDGANTKESEFDNPVFEEPSASPGFDEEY